MFFTTKLIRESNRLGDNEIWDSFNEDLPYILGGIFDLLSSALKMLPTVKVDKPVRLADFHRFGYAVAEAMGNRGKEFDEVLKSNKDRQMEITCENAMLIRF